MILTFLTRVPSVAVNLNLQYGFKLGNVKTCKQNTSSVNRNKETNTLNCSSEQMSTLCDVMAVDKVGETFSELTVVGTGTFGVEGVDSIVGILEPCPIE